ncbi:DUF3311 domain-containing protein [Rhodopirellula sallentina]|uniref:Putative membrane protein n=1 Tax=Rhodopirellula sallentina SM41 TaxID=1263870 RepID=M5TUP0_9BACT|nr:DUF3311 domain-containing protein [Rhodopirellula sallentina]EMI52754.1 putative membrane protein [Rhodopirellula sallentina SM41]
MTESPHASDASAASPSRTESSRDGGHSGLWIIAALVLLLLILHQDNWFWTDGRLVFGVIPVGLFWHACLSIGASFTWFLATRIAWPIEPEFEVTTSPRNDAAAVNAPEEKEGEK